MSHSTLLQKDEMAPSQSSSSFVFVAASRKPFLLGPFSSNTNVCT